jgi:Polyketide cyclase / dehydrase and lipid transport
MWKRSYTTHTSEVTAEALWDTLADVNNWTTWTTDLEWTKLEGPAALGKDFYLKPKGGPKTRITIIACDRPRHYTDLGHLLLCKMTFIHAFTPTPHGVRIDMEVRMSGPLTFLWSKVIGEKQAADFADHTQALITEARKR